jgi:hypothetical protein
VDGREKASRRMRRMRMAGKLMIDYSVVRQGCILRGCVDGRLKLRQPQPFVDALSSLSGYILQRTVGKRLD